MSAFVTVRIRRDHQYETRPGIVEDRKFQVVRRMGGISLLDIHEGYASDCFAVDIQTALSLVLQERRWLLVKVPRTKEVTP